MAIRQNTHSLVEMINAVYASSLYHIASTDENPNHSMCPIGEDSWCKWQKDPENYNHQYGLPEPVVELLESIYEDLSDPNLHAKCLHGKTQNPNEYLNKVIWSRCPKEVWVSFILVTNFFKIFLVTNFQKSLTFDFGDLKLRDLAKLWFFKLILTKSNFKKSVMTSLQ